MLSAPDFNKKQIVFVLFNEGEKLAFNNDNMVVKNFDGEVKFQCTCYRLYIIYAVGHCSITSVLLQKARKFGFFIAMLSPSFRIYALLGAEKDGNTMLKRKQYEYSGLDLAKHIVRNKIHNQKEVLKSVRDKNDIIKEAITSLDAYYDNVIQADRLQEVLAFEGLSSKQYFKAHFNNICWKGRQPRLKRDCVNAVLDIGYTLLFSFVDSLLCAFGFDTFCGVLHQQFYMRKSLVCDIVEPFRPLIDMQVKKSFNLKQIKEEDFLIINFQYRLKWEKTASYVQFLMGPIIERKDSIFIYIQAYYRAFMKGICAEEFPRFLLEESK